MFLRLVKIIGLSFLLSTSLMCETLAGAYRAYSAGSYEEALGAYKEVLETTPSDDATYGVINSLVALGRYKEALPVTQGGQGDIYRAKEVWVLGLLNKENEAQQLRSRALKGKDVTTQISFLNSGGWGFYGAENFKEAQQWFETSLELGITDDTKTALEQTQKSAKEKVLWTGTLFGGPLLYEQSPISDINGRYQYKGGSFLSMATRWDISKKQWVEISYSHFGAQFQPWVYRDSTAPGWDTTITPEPKHQNTFYGAYGYKGVGGRPFDLQGAVIIAGSNIRGIGATSAFDTTGVIGTAYVGHSNHLGKFDLGAHWYGTLGDSLQVGQVTADAAVHLGPATVSLLPTAVWSPLTMQGFEVKGMQYSFRAKVGVASKHTYTEISGIWGDRIYTNESGGQNMVTITLPHTFTTTFNFLVAPGAGKVSLFTIFRYENYEQMYRVIALGGLAVSL